MNQESYFYKDSKHRKFRNSQLALNVQTRTCCTATAAAETAAGQLVAANTAAGHLDQCLSHQARRVIDWLELVRKLQQQTTLPMPLAWLRAPQLPGFLQLGLYSLATTEVATPERQATDISIKSSRCAWGL